MGPCRQCPGPECAPDAHCLGQNPSSRYAKPDVVLIHSMEACMQECPRSPTLDFNLLLAQAIMGRKMLAASPLPLLSSHPGQSCWSQWPLL